MDKDILEDIFKKLKSSVICNTVTIIEGILLIINITLATFLMINVLVNHDWALTFLATAAMICARWLLFTCNNSINYNKIYDNIYDKHI